MKLRPTSTQNIIQTVAVVTQVTAEGRERRNDSMIQMEVYGVGEVQLIDMMCVEDL